MRSSDHLGRLFGDDGQPVVPENDLSDYFDDSLGLGPPMSTRGSSNSSSTYSGWYSVV
jgi:hypothetical protein